MAVLIVVDVNLITPFPDVLVTGTTINVVLGIVEFPIELYATLLLHTIPQLAVPLRTGAVSEGSESA